jgi:hypothetical protein
MWCEKLLKCVILVSFIERSVPCETVEPETIDTDYECLQGTKTPRRGFIFRLPEHKSHYPCSLFPWSECTKDPHLLQSKAWHDYYSLLTVIGGENGLSSDAEWGVSNWAWVIHYLFLRNLSL